MRLLVCGGRWFDDREGMWQILDKINELYGVSAVIVGDATGADRLAGEWALARTVPLEEYCADWKKHGRAAGPKRNQRMLDEGEPNMVVAFPGGVGTMDMVQKAIRKRGVDVLVLNGAQSRAEARR